MATTIITQEDLQVFKTELLLEIQKLLLQKAEAEPESKWLKSHQVMRMLGISPGTLQNMRVNGTIPYSKVGGVIFYNNDDINAIMKHHKRNVNPNGKLF
jgi:hypothetical protein